MDAGVTTFSSELFPNIVYKAKVKMVHTVCLSSLSTTEQQNNTFSVGCLNSISLKKCSAFMCFTGSILYITFSDLITVT